MLRKQELTGGRSGAAGNPVHGSLMGCFSLRIWLPSLFSWSTVALWLALWCCQVKPSVRWHCSGHQHRLVWSGWCVPWNVFQVGVWFHLCTHVQGFGRMLSHYMTPHFLSFGVKSFGCTRMDRRVFTGLWYTLTPCCLNVLDSLSDKPCTYGSRRPMEGGLVLPLLADVGFVFAFCFGTTSAHSV